MRLLLVFIFLFCEIVAAQAPTLIRPSCQRQAFTLTEAAIKHDQQFVVGPVYQADAEPVSGWVTDPFAPVVASHTHNEVDPSGNGTAIAATPSASATVSIGEWDAGQFYWITWWRDGIWEIELGAPHETSTSFLPSAGAGVGAVPAGETHTADIGSAGTGRAKEVLYVTGPKLFYLVRFEAQFVGTNPDASPPVDWSGSAQLKLGDDSVLTLTYVPAAGHYLVQGTLRSVTYAKVTINETYANAADIPVYVTHQEVDNGATFNCEASVNPGQTWPTKGQTIDVIRPGGIPIWNAADALIAKYRITGIYED